MGSREVLPLRFTTTKCVEQFLAAMELHVLSDQELAEKAIAMENAKIASTQGMYDSY